MAQFSCLPPNLQRSLHCCGQVISGQCCYRLCRKHQQNKRPLVFDTPMLGVVVRGYKRVDSALPLDVPHAERHNREDKPPHIYLDFIHRDGLCRIGKGVSKTFEQGSGNFDHIALFTRHPKTLNGPPLLAHKRNRVSKGWYVLDIPGRLTYRQLLSGE